MRQARGEMTSPWSRPSSASNSFVRLKLVITLIFLFSKRLRINLVVFFSSLILFKDFFSISSPTESNALRIFWKRIQSSLFFCLVSSNILYFTIILSSLCIITLTTVLQKVLIKTISYTLDRSKFYSSLLEIGYS